MGQCVNKATFSKNCVKKNLNVNIGFKLAIFDIVEYVGNKSVVR